MHIVCSASAPTTGARQPNLGVIACCWRVAGDLRQSDATPLLETLLLYSKGSD